MKLLRFGEPGCEKPGMVDKNGDLRDISELASDISGGFLSAENLERLRNLDHAAFPRVDANTRLGPCVGKVGKFICIGLNYSDHAEEAGMDVPDEPVVFMKATSAISGPNDPIIVPRGASKLDWEVELAIVIGATARNVAKETALDYVAGYCIANDVSERTFQIERGGQWTKGKSADTFGPIGPWLVTKDELSDVGDLDMRLSVNGELMQSGSTNTMIFDVPTIVSHLSDFMSLHPGDVISTGTPPGVGMGLKPPQYLSIGDTVELEIQGLGKQKQVVTSDIANSKK